VPIRGCVERLCGREVLLMTEKNRFYTIEKQAGRLAKRREESDAF
jgi:hypothetical protein